MARTKQTPPSQFLQRQNAIYTARAGEWRTIERRMRGGSDVLPELQTFDYAPYESAAHQMRMRRARYINFADDVASMIVGHVMRAQVTINFGALGKVERAEGQTQPSRAERLYYNTDGIGNDASQWPNFWRKQMRMAFGTGHRWIYVDQKGDAPKSLADEIAGQRPYLYGKSPAGVPDFDFENGQLLYIIFRHRKAATGRRERPRYTLMTRQGFDEFGPQYAEGGWFDFNEQYEPIPGRSGAWLRTLGEIPVTPLYYERDDGTEGDDEEVGASGTSVLDFNAWRTKGLPRHHSLPAMSKSGAFELSQCAIDYMNLTSSQSFDAWDAAMSSKDILGASIAQFKTAKKLADAGSRWRVWPRDQDGNTPTIQDGSTGTVTADVFEKILARIFTEVNFLAAREIGVAGPEASGASRQAAFTAAQSPRLANMASELENAWNNCIRWCEMRWLGETNPSGVASISRQFDIVRLATNVAEFFAIAAAANLHSKTLEVESLIRGAKDLALITDDDQIPAIRAELQKAFDANALEAAQQVVNKAQASSLQTTFATQSATSLERPAAGVI